jgi:hypothetical protein
MAEVCGTLKVGVKTFDIKGTTEGEGSKLCYTDVEVRRHGYRTGLETLVVHAVNDKHWIFPVFV